MLCNIARCWPSKESLKHSFPQAPGRAEKRGGGEGARNRPLVKHTFLGAMKPLCPLCSTRHEVWQGHVFASNAASNTRSASNNASNGKLREVRGGDESARKELVVAVPEALAGVGADADERGAGVVEAAGQAGGDKARKQRWTRESYNAYQREYMKVYRAVKSGRAEKVRFA